MAQRSLKPFYITLGAIAVVGGGALVVQSQRASAPVVMPSTPVPAVLDSVPPEAYQLGSDTAPVVVDEWSDFECPYCAQLAVLIKPDVKRRYIETGLVRWRYNDFPLAGHRNAPTAHLAAACAARQDRFWPMHDLIYSNRGIWTRGDVRDHMRDLAQQADVDLGSWDACMESEEPLTRIAQWVQLGQSRGVRATPTLFINGRPIQLERLSFDEMAAHLDAALAARR